jgi:hypothetical protein
MLAVGALESDLLHTLSAPAQGGESHGDWTLQPG